MANVLNRTTKEYRRSVNDPEYSPVDWIINPDLSAVAGFPSEYWVIAGDVVTLMSKAERDAVDAAAAKAEVDRDRLDQKSRMDKERLLKAMAVYFAKEINILRAAHGLAPRSAADVRDGIKAEVDNV